MKKISSICLFSPGFPYGDDADYPFVEQLCIAISKLGIRIKVVCPQSLTSALIHRKKIHPLYRVLKKDVGGDIEVYQPIYFSLPDRFKRINYKLQSFSARFIKKHIKACDVCYCHFWSSALIAKELFQNTDKPIFVASGESDISSLLGETLSDVKKIKNIKGVIAVSTKNLDESVGLKLVDRNIVGVFPNSIDNSLFYKRNSKDCRKLLGLPTDAFIVAFVGGFIERKGTLRVSDALSGLNDIYSVFIGSGSQDPKCSNILHKGPVSHSEIPLYLNASDIFVLPTLKEGCCNAIIEAMACGLPVVSSNLSFNWDVLDETNSILIDPTDIDQIHSSIKELCSNVELRQKLSQGALKTASLLTIEARAKNIINFIESKL